MALYRLPFPIEATKSTWDVRGNWDQGGHGVGQTNNPTDEQAYAIDINHATGGKILAARAGTVIWLDEQWPDDTHPEDGTPGPGNYIWIRHGNGTMAAYLHLKQNSVRVKEGQYVLQGSWIAESGNTGRSSGGHLHIDVHTYGEKGKVSAPELGTQLLMHFEDETRTSFRPAAGEFLSGKSNNVDGVRRRPSGIARPGQLVDLSARDASCSAQLGTVDTRQPFGLYERSRYGALVSRRALGPRARKASSNRHVQPPAAARSAHR